MFAALALLSPGCKQDEGERCQTAPAPPDASADVPPTDVMFEPSGE
jgi:hypothetical protein